MSIFAGDTNYRNFPKNDIAGDLSFFLKYSKQIIDKNKAELFKHKTQIDLMSIFGEIISFAEKLRENKNINSLKLWIGKPDLEFCKKLQKMGPDALELSCKIGQTWNRNGYHSLFKEGSIEIKNYAELRDYIETMRDLSNIGDELENRFFYKGKPLYKELNIWRYFLDLYESTIKVLFNK